MTNVKEKTGKPGCSKCRFSKVGCNGPRCHRTGPPIAKKGTVNKTKGTSAKKGNKKTKSSGPEQPGHSEQHGHLEQKVYEKKKKNPALRFIENEASESSDTSQQSSDDSSNSSNSDYDYNDGFLQEDDKIWKEVGGKWRIINDEEETERDDRSEMSNKEQLTLERNRTTKALDELSRNHKKIKTLQRKYHETKRKVQKLEKKVTTWKQRATDQLLKNDKIQEQMLKQQQEKR